MVIDILYKLSVNSFIGDYYAMAKKLGLHHITAITLLL